MVHNDTRPWGGTFQGQVQASDLYLYYMKVRSRLGKEEELRGEILLIR